MIRVKICGMQSLEEVGLCVQAGADALGFIFSPSERRLSIEEAAPLTTHVPPFVTTVGVFADSPVDLVRSAVNSCRLDVLQFSGTESASFCGSFGRPTIVVMRERALGETFLTKAKAAAVLMDSQLPNKFGGTGVPVNRKVAVRLRKRTGAPFILAGGLTAANVGEAVFEIRPDAVDVRSGVERNGKKDAFLVHAFMRAVKSP